jgi:hypothetical protein
MISKAAFFAFPIFVLVPLTLSSQGSNAGRAGFDLPQPNGCHPVGTRTVVLRDPHRSRDLLVTMWYPAVEGTSALAPYMDKKTADALAEEWKLQPDFQRLCARTLDSWHPSLWAAPFQLFFWNTAQVLCQPSTQFWLRAWRVVASLWSPPIIPLTP